MITDEDFLMEIKGAIVSYENGLITANDFIHRIDTLKDAFISCHIGYKVIASNINATLKRLDKSTRQKVLDALIK